MIEVVRPGMSTTVQDQGRPGLQRFGVAAGGAADPFAAEVANLLAGNAAGDSLLEIVWIGPRLRFVEAALVAWVGGGFDALLDGGPLVKGRPVWVPAGGVVEFPQARQGAMAWLAVAGGIAVPEVLGSRSTDAGAGWGGVEGRALVAGDVLPVGEPTPWALAMIERLRGAGRRAPDWFVDPEVLMGRRGLGVLRALRGPEWDWFPESVRAGFFRQVFRVTKDISRMGLRLEGVPMRLDSAREMVSGAVDHGVVQVPPSGQPIVLGAGRQATGGYPRIAVVAAVDCGRLAQLRPGDGVRFAEITTAEAHRLLLERGQVLARAAKHLHLTI